MAKELKFSRRQFMAWAGVLGAGLILPDGVFAASDPIRKAIPKTGEMLPVIGMGTSRTFDAAGDAALFARLQQVTQTFFDMGGGMIDSSPMYDSAEEVIGRLLPKVTGKKNLFAATKVWIDGKQEGVEQMEASRRLWGVKQFDLIQVHNLVDWRTQLDTLKQMKANGKIRYLGVTTSHGRFHGKLKTLLIKHDVDFVQLSYNIGNRDVESTLLPIAGEKGIAVIANRPYQRGALFRHVRGKPLPSWAREFDCASWGQYFLKYVVSHPVITCTIPATSKVKHMKDNMMASRGRLPDGKQRIKMARYLKSL